MILLQILIVHRDSLLAHCQNGVADRLVHAFFPFLFKAVEYTDDSLDNMNHERAQTLGARAKFGTICETPEPDAVALSRLREHWR